MRAQRGRQCDLGAGQQEMRITKLARPLRDLLEAASGLFYLNANLSTHALNGYGRQEPIAAGNRFMGDFTHMHISFESDERLAEGVLQLNPQGAGPVIYPDGGGWSRSGRGHSGGHVQLLTHANDVNVGDVIRLRQCVRRCTVQACNTAQRIAIFHHISLFAHTSASVSIQSSYSICCGSSSGVTSATHSPLPISAT